MSCCVLCYCRQIPPLHLVTVQCGRNTFTGSFFFTASLPEELRKTGFSLACLAFCQLKLTRLLGFSLVTKAKGKNGKISLFIFISPGGLKKWGNVFTGVVINVAIQLTHSQSRERSWNLEWDFLTCLHLLILMHEKQTAKEDRAEEPCYSIQCPCCAFNLVLSISRSLPWF